MPTIGVSAWVRVQSSWVEAIAHWVGPDGRGWLGLRTKDGHEYHYANVSRYIFHLLRDRESKGKGMWALIFKRYKAIKVR